MRRQEERTNAWKSGGFGESDEVFEEAVGSLRKRQFLPVIVAALIFLWGLNLFLLNAQNFWVSLKPVHDIQDIPDNGIAAGMHVAGEVPFVYDCFADMSDLEGKNVSQYYYAFPAGEGMIILEMPVSMKEAMETLLSETIEYLGGGKQPVSTVAVEGRAVEAQGRLPYLLSEYMKSIGYTQAEIDAMGEPLMIKNIGKAKRDAPVGMIMMAVGILMIVAYVFQSRARARKETG